MAVPKKKKEKEHNPIHNPGIKWGFEKMGPLDGNRSDHVDGKKS